MQIVPLSATVLTVFKSQITGKAKESELNVSDSDLASLGSSLVMSLMPFQKEGVKCVNALLFCNSLYKVEIEKLCLDPYWYQH